MRDRSLLIAALVCFICAAFCAEAMCDGFEAGMVMASGADLATTEYALRSGNPVMEGNPLLRDQAGRLAIKAAGTALLVYAYRKLKGKNETAARILAVCAMAGWSVIAMWNFRMARMQ
jgi:hypothetical protein